MRQSWTPEDDAAIREVYATGAHGKAGILAKRLGRTTGAIYQRAQDIGIAERRTRDVAIPNDDRPRSKPRADARKVPPRLPVAASSFIAPITRERLMAGR